MSSEHASGGIDLDFRPASYFVQRDPAPALLQSIKGDLRRAVARDALQAGREIDAAFYSEAAPQGFRDRMERVDPRWMGGEYLPDFDEGEVEIARLVLASVTQDVYSVRARWVGSELRYRIVDEYETDWYLRRESSERPLSMRELVKLIDGATFLDNEWDDLTNALRDGACGDSDPESAVDFVTVSSELYPELGRYYAAKAEAWLARRGGTRTPTALAMSPRPLGLPPDTPGSVRERLERLAAAGALLSEDQMRQLLLGPDQTPLARSGPPDIALGAREHPDGPRLDIEPEPEEEGIALIEPEPRLRLVEDAGTDERDVRRRR